MRSVGNTVTVLLVAPLDETQTKASKTEFFLFIYFFKVDDTNVRHHNLKSGISGTYEKMSWRFLKKNAVPHKLSQQIKNRFVKNRAVTALCKNPTRRQLVAFTPKIRSILQRHLTSEP